MSASTAETYAAQANFIDVHYHAGPDAYLRRHSAVQAGHHYQAQNGWVVLKNHLGCTAAQAWEAREQGLPVSGSIVLNEIAGGIDWRVVERSLCQHGAADLRFIVHLPTVTGRSHTSRLARSLSHPILSERPIKPLTVSDDSGQLTPATLDLLRMSRDYPVVISTGHANREEVLRLVEAADRLQVPRLMLNQPANPLTGLNAEDLLALGNLPFLYIEQTALTYLLEYQGRDDFSRVLRELPQVVYSSDLGQTSQPDIAQWLKMSQQWFEEFGLSKERVESISRGWPLQMLRH
ncbi:DUF6282 family protein [Pseudomonas frederiksbergensis]|uniref:Amidohydrolase-related domain-containing protein n=1 Tax=Pseudomonas frederiksbergensis TaxID=104087 RepID=A0A423KN84_9PSED|nr:DUF6282 family protein [Pseudomonas frederiksbergensis]RON55859.1 hypothetical protein BK665_07815 [Pseudomonas frederiksbergensis]